MRRTEWVQLVAYVKMRSPQTFIVEGTAEAWYPDVADYDAEAVQQSIDTLSRRPGNLPIALGDLLVEIRKVRNLRLERHGDPVITADPDDREAYRAELARARKVIADGGEWPTHPFGELPVRPVKALAVGKPMPAQGYPGPTRRVLDSERMKQARAEVEAQRKRDAESAETTEEEKADA